MFLGISSFMVYSYVTNHLRIIKRMSKVYIMFLLVLGIKVISTITILLTFLLRRRFLTKAFDKMKEVDLQIKQLNEKPLSYKTYYILFFFACSCIPIFHISYVVINYRNTQNMLDVFDELFSQRIQHEICLFVTYYFFFYVMLLYERFALINQIIFKLNKPRIQNNPSTSFAMLCAAAKMHENLCKGAAYMNEALSVPLFFTVVSQLIEIVLMAYMTYQGENVPILESSISCVVQLLNLLIPSRLAQTKVSEKNYGVFFCTVLEENYICRYIRYVIIGMCSSIERL